jgi:hypothetical protein
MLQRPPPAGRARAVKLRNDPRRPQASHLHDVPNVPRAHKALLNRIEHDVLRPLRRKNVDQPVYRRRPNEPDVASMNTEPTQALPDGGADASSLSKMTTGPSNEAVARRARVDFPEPGGPAKQMNAP